MYALSLLIRIVAAMAMKNVVSVEFVVAVPPETKPADRLVLVGNLAAVGQWRAENGVALRRREDGCFAATIDLPEGATLEYKIARGSWDSVEKGPAGEELPNRVLRVDHPRTVSIRVATWSDSGGAAASRPAAASRSIAGTLRLHRDFASKALGNTRTLAVWMPPAYDRRPSERYAVLYMQDGQNVFDAATSFLGVEWRADETADRLIRAGRMTPIIIVGLYNTPDRMNEYTPTRDAARHAGGRGDDYVRFLVDEAKPFIDRTYRTLPDRAHTAVAGSSLGGLISLHAAATRPDVFSMVGVVSPALMWDDDRIIRQLAARPDALRRLQIWLDMGTNEGRQVSSFGQAIESARRLVNVFDQAGLAPGRDYYYWEVAGGEHNESAWAARLDKMLLFFFASPPGR